MTAIFVRGLYELSLNPWAMELIGTGATIAAHYGVGEISQPGGAISTGIRYGVSGPYRFGDLSPSGPVEKGPPTLNPSLPTFNRRRWQQQNVIKKVKRFKKRRRG